MSKRNGKTAKICGIISSSVKLTLVSLARSFNQNEITCVYGPEVEFVTAEKELDLVVGKKHPNHRQTTLCSRGSSY